MFGVVKFYNACKKAGIKPIIGCEVYMANGSRFSKPDRGERSYHHLILLCKNNVGYQNLIYLVSKGYTEGFYTRPRIDLELLEDHTDGLICLSACMVGYIPQAILRGDTDDALNYAKKLENIFGKDNFYLEIQDHGQDEDAVINRGIKFISEKTGIPMVATNDVHYLRRNDAETQSILMAISTGGTIGENSTGAFASDSFYLRTEEEMSELFEAYPGAVENTVRIANECDVDLDFHGYVFPRIQLDDGVDPGDYLRDLCREGLKKRIADGEIDLNAIPEDEYKNRIEYELSTIIKMGFAEYFIIVRDFVAYAKDNGISVGPGRGSGAASLVAYLIRITDVDPLRFGLLFETFLNPERVSMPDFDVDFHHIRRDEVFEYVKRRYGSDHVSKIVTFGTLAARAAVRKVGKVLGMPYPDVDAIAKLIPQHEPGDQSKKMTLDRALEITELKDLYNSSEKARMLLDRARDVEGFPGNMSTHPAGVVISDKPLDEYAPLAVTGNVTVTQYDMDSVSELGLLKFDFLGLRELTTIDSCVEKIKASDPDFDIRKIPFDDKETYDLISRGDTVGIFQLESTGMRRMLSGLKPENINDVMLALALYRPGATKFINTLLENRRNNVRSKYPIDGMKEILDETYGCIVYSEQVIQILCSVAGYSLGKADVVSRAIKKKKHDVIEAERSNFIEGAVAKGAKPSDAEELFNDIEGFSKYGFKKSHAAAYGITSYRTAYLKAHYPAFYFASIMTTELGETSSVVKYIDDMERFGIKLLPPDINESDDTFTVTASGDIRYGLLALKNVGSVFARTIVEERKTRPFSGFIDFAERMSVYDSNKKQFESLIKSGAFDSLGVNRRTLLTSYDELIDLIAKKRRSVVDGQIDMFAANDDYSSFFSEQMPEFDLRVKLFYEREVSGKYMSANPLDEYENVLRSIEHTRISDIVDKVDEDDDGEDIYRIDHGSVVVAGLVTGVTLKDSKSGKMAFVTLEDKTGSVELIVFSDIYKNHSDLFVLDEACLVDGEISTRENEPPKIIVRSVKALRGLPEKGTNIRSETSEKVKTDPERKLYLRVSRLDSPVWKRANAVINIFGGSTKIVVYDQSSGKYSVLSNKGVTADGFVIGELSELLGPENVVYK